MPNPERPPSSRRRPGPGASSSRSKIEGRGIPPADLERVFEKFTRLGTGDGRPAGTGLGLAIAKGVVEAMGGTIRAESPVRTGRGTRIVIDLPAAETGAATLPAAGEE